MRSLLLWQTHYAIMKNGWRSLQNIIYSDLCPYSIIQPHKLKRVFDQSTSQTTAFPANYSVTSLDSGILFFMSNFKKKPQHNSVCYILSCPNWTRRGVCSLALHSNLLFLQAVSTQSSLASVTQLSLFKFFSHKSCFPELWSLPSVSLLNSSSPFSVLYTPFFSTLFTIRLCSLQLVADTGFFHWEPAALWQADPAVKSYLDSFIFFFLGKTENNEINEPLAWSSFAVGFYCWIKLLSEKCLESPEWKLLNTHMQK